MSQSTPIIAAMPMQSALGDRPNGDLTPAVRAMVGVAAAGLTAICVAALLRAGVGFAPHYPGTVGLAIVLHVSAVIPAVPLGGWLLLAPKGTPGHKALGKLWVGLMLVTALSALFIRQINGGSLSWIHLFVPLTLYGAWKSIATARSGQISAHRKQMIGFYLGALIVPGAVSFLPGRMMWLLLLG